MQVCKYIRTTNTERKFLPAIELKVLFSASIFTFSIRSHFYFFTVSVNPFLLPTLSDYNFQIDCPTHITILAPKLNTIYYSSFIRTRIPAAILCPDLNALADNDNKTLSPQSQFNYNTFQAKVSFNCSHSSCLSHRF